MSPPLKPPMFGDPARWAIVQADSLAFLRQLPSCSVDSVICDPPYGIGFAGKAWDAGALLDGHGFESWTTAWASEVNRILRPGGHVAAFGAARTMHRLVCGVEDAGLEVRDQVLWLYGSGVPKGRRLDYGLSTALKPAYEPILLARRPFVGSVNANLERWGVGAFDIENSRVRGEFATLSAPEPTPARWPANIALTHEPHCTREGCSQQCAAIQLNRGAGADVSRFFYSAKASRTEREAGLAGLPVSTTPIFSGSGTAPRANLHPTVKPISVMRWLTRLIAPPEGLVLDPFTGSGSTGIAALLEGRQFLGIERETEYVRVAVARLAHWDGAPPGHQT